MKCNLCGMPVMWATTKATGKSIPLALPPVANGNIWLEDGPVNPRTGRPKPLAVFASATNEVPEGKRRYRNHHLTCRVYQAKKAMEALLK